MRIGRNRRVRTVRAPGGRQWVLRREIRWRIRPADTVYEHDITSGGAWLINGALIVFWLVIGWLYVSTSATIPWPLWLIVAIGAVVLGIRYYLFRPWRLTAEAAEPIERWTGVVRGWSAGRAEIRATERAIRISGSPHRRDGILEQVEGSTQVLRWPPPPEKP